MAVRFTPGMTSMVNNGMGGLRVTGLDCEKACEALNIEDKAEVSFRLVEIIQHLKKNPPVKKAAAGVSQKDPKDVALAESLFIKNFWSLVEDVDLDPNDDWGLHMPKLTGFGGLTFRYITPSASRNTIYVEEVTVSGRTKQRLMLKEDKKLVPATWDEAKSKWVKADKEDDYYHLEDYGEWEADLKLSAPAEYAKRMKMRDIQGKVPAKPKKKR